MATHFLTNDDDDLRTRSLAFGSRTQAEAAASAKESGWEQVSKRLWLCPDCKKKFQQLEQKK